MTTKDALSPYRAKRDFSITTEPSHKGETHRDALSYVVQKHWASHLHYDFRLELDGTMKSWAVPKGPSFDSKVKRMAIHVEDHPLSYFSFEGTIPPNQYGAGKVIVWDSGTWHPTGDPHKGLSEGHLKFMLDGHKLHGRWVLVRMKGKEQKQDPWLLIKENDEFERTSADFSVVDELPDSVHAVPPRPVARRKTKTAHLRTELPAEALAAPLPHTLLPQLATLTDGPPPDAQAWSYEIKFDGYRLLTRVDGAEIKLFTRNGNDWTSKLRPLRTAITTMKLPPGWYDGEIVVPNEKGVPDFGALQQVFAVGKSQDIVLYLFDLPYFDGHDLRAVPLESRRAILQGLLKKAPEQVRFSEDFESVPEDVLASACKLGLEGVIAKRRDSAYVSRRTANWIKLKCGHRQEFVIGGFTDPQGARIGLGALLLGTHDAEGALRYAGKVGTGFDDRSLPKLKAQLDALSAAKNPFAKSSAISAKAHWVKPTLIAEVSFGEWTRDGHIRHAVFRGLRTDKGATFIVREKAIAARKIAGLGRMNKDRLPGRDNSLPLSGLRITNPERVIDASTGTTKLELLRYYGVVGELMMEHLKDRPVSLLRAPDGVSGQLFFQKHAEIGKLPGILQLDRSLDTSHPAMLTVAAKRGLLSAAQWNVIEFHTLNTGTKTFEHPDRMVFDLDPGDGVGWTQVQEAAQLVHAFLTQLGLTAFLKTSGGKGLHLVVPLRKLHDWNSVKGFSQAIVSHLARSIPERFVAKSGPKNRVGKIFIDYLRNGIGASTVCAWSARARPGLGISVPVAWSELSMIGGGDHWNVRTAHKRLDQGNAPWTGYDKAARSLKAAIKTLDYKPRRSP